MTRRKREPMSEGKKNIIAEKSLTARYSQTSTLSLSRRATQSLKKR